MRKPIIISLFLSSCLLSACAHLDAPEAGPETGGERAETVPDTWPDAQRRRRAIHSWELRGQLGIQTAETGGSMTFNWRQDGAEYVIRLQAPMGRGRYLLSGDENGAVVRQPDGSSHYLSNLDELFEQVFGVKLPVRALKDWLRGLPAEGMAVTAIHWNESGLIETMQQSGWRIELKKYLGEPLLPHKIFMSREDDESLDIRLALRQWMIDN